MRLAALVPLLTFLAAASAAPAATFHVTKPEDTADGVCDADCSLREAVIAANASPGTDEIVIPEGTYSLTIPGEGEDAAATGDLDVTEDVAISGAGEEATTVDASAVEGAFEFLAGASELAGLTLVGTAVRSFGDTLRNVGALTLHAVHVDCGNQDFSYGVSNYYDAQLDAAQVRISRCESGVWNYGTSRFIDLELSENYGGLYAAFGTTEIDRALIARNQYVGVFVLADLDTPPTARIVDSIFRENGALWGHGALVVWGNAVVTGSTFVDNGPAAVAAVTAQSRDDAAGTVRLVNCTLTGNEVGVIADANYLGGSAIVVNSTIVGDNGVLSTLSYTGGHGEVELYDSVLDASCTLESAYAYVPLPELLGRGNVVTRGKCLAPETDANRFVVDPLLGPLQDNGGPTPTLALLPGSPAIDAALDAACEESGFDPDCGDLDQRGLPRPRDGDEDGLARPDAGAFEYGAEASPGAAERIWRVVNDRTEPGETVGTALLALLAEAAGAP